ncbi:MAG: UvrB/UvrC motif-containing protein [Victivallaceae bacterium]|nr:UvrB/UvrC motif-containing protein [Victivallaceae bacterium]MDD3703372.1 UvrB/UvrC motif-containing protein [Victivallaceae bacterium]
MLCDNCHKNEATIHIQEVAQGKKNSLHLCASCAAEKSIDSGLGTVGGFNISQLLYDISNNFGLPGLSEALNKSQAAPKKGGNIKSAEPLMVCPECKWDSNQLRQTGRLGCAKCYETFKTILDKALPNMHRGKIHIGKCPSGSAANAAPRRMQELLELQKQLDHAVRDEEYEKAAEFRDRINEIKKELNSARKKSGKK